VFLTFWGRQLGPGGLNVLALDRNQSPLPSSSPSIILDLVFFSLQGWRPAPKAYYPYLFDSYPVSGTLPMGSCYAWGVVISKDPQNKPLRISPSDLYYRRAEVSVATAGGLEISPLETLSWALRGVNRYDVAADYSGASHSTVWNMFLYVDLGEHRIHRDNVS
jgi:hypothetical protein